MTANCSIRLFADDALIYATGSSRQEINERLNEQMIRVDDWLSRNRLYPNVSKTKAMLIRGIRRKVAEQDFKVTFRGGELEVVNKIRYLGMVLDKNLNFAEHVDYIGRKIGAKLGVLRRVGNNMTPYMRYIIYKSVIAPLFDYCASVLIDLSKTGWQYLQKLQNKAMKVVLRCNRGVRTADMLQALNFMSIKERIEFNVCLLIFKMINGRFPSYLRDRVNLIRYEGALATSRGDKVCIERYKTSEQQRMLLHNGFKMFNDLSCEVRGERDLKYFRRMLVQHIKSRERLGGIL